MSVLYAWSWSTIQDKQLSIRTACAAFGISETCYRYRARLSSENEAIADWLIRLITHQRNWGFGLCFLYLRNVKPFGWNHKRVYRIYRELELNLRIKPRRRLVREKPLALAVPTQINEVWSMDFMHDQLDVLDRINRRYGKNTLMFAAGTLPTSRCHMRRQRKSQDYTTKWGGIPVVG